MQNWMKRHMPVTSAVGGWGMGDQELKVTHCYTGSVKPSGYMRAPLKKKKKSHKIRALKQISLLQGLPGICHLSVVSSAFVLFPAALGLGLCKRPVLEGPAWGKDRGGAGWGFSQWPLLSKICRNTLHAQRGQCGSERVHAAGPPAASWRHSRETAVQQAFPLTDHECERVCRSCVVADGTVSIPFPG